VVVVSEWVGVGGADEVAEGELAAFEVGGRYVAVARIDGDIYAFDDVCTHRGCSLSEGELDGMSVVCPCHAGEFDVRTGEVLSGPPPEPVAAYPARIVGGALEIQA
jgi:3-phenylpropionate/trans-cinnamate dioxygenase ferredoxin subunit